MSEHEETDGAATSTIKLRLPAIFKGEVEAVAASLQISVSALTRLALVSYMKANQAPAAEPRIEEEAAA